MKSMLMVFEFHEKCKGNLDLVDTETFWTQRNANKSFDNDHIIRYNGEPTSKLKCN